GLFPNAQAGDFVLMELWLWLLMQDAIPVTSPWATLLQWGVLGLVVLMLLTGWLWAKPSVEEMRTRHAEERKMWEEKILPALEKLSTQLEDNNKLLAELLRRTNNESR